MNKKLPIEIVNRIFMFMESNTNQLMKLVINFYKTNNYGVSFRTFYFVNIRYHLVKSGKTYSDSDY